MKRVFTLAILALAIGATVSACEKSDTSGPFVEPEQDFVEAATPNPKLSVEGGDKVNVKLHVFTARGLKLRDADPVEVLVPAEVKFTFKKLQFVQPNPGAGPLEIAFEIPRNLAKGEYTLRLPMKLYYYAGDGGEVRSRNELLSVPIKVDQRYTQYVNTHDYPVEYLLE